MPAEGGTWDRRGRRNRERRQGDRGDSTSGDRQWSPGLADRTTDRVTRSESYGPWMLVEKRKKSRFRVGSQRRDRVQNKAEGGGMPWTDRMKGKGRETLKEGDGTFTFKAVYIRGESSIWPDRDKAHPFIEKTQEKEQRPHELDKRVTLGLLSGMGSISHTQVYSNSSGQSPHLHRHYDRKGSSAAPKHTIAIQEVRPSADLNLKQWSHGRQGKARTPREHGGASYVQRRYEAYVPRAEAKQQAELLERTDMREEQQDGGEREWRGTAELAVRQELGSEENLRGERPEQRPETRDEDKQSAHKRENCRELST